MSPCWLLLPLLAALGMSVWAASPGFCQVAECPAEVWVGWCERVDVWAWVWESSWVQGRVSRTLGPRDVGGIRVADIWVTSAESEHCPQAHAARPTHSTGSAVSTGH